MLNPLRFIKAVFIVFWLILPACQLHAMEQTVYERIVRDPIFQRIIYHSYRPGAINEQGIAYQNIISNKGFDIWYQQICWDAIVAGIGRRQERHIELGLKAISYGFERMEDDGSFENSSIPGSLRFLLAFARSYYQIINSEYRQRYIKRLDSYRSELARATYHILNSPEWKAERYRIEDFTNQVLAAGLVFKLIGSIIEDQKLMDYGKMLFYRGINSQRQDGVFPEKGGHDSSYQAVSLQFIALYYLYLADEAQKTLLWSKLQKGWQWELSRIEGTGRIKVEGNTRTGLKKEKWHGRFKDVNYRDVAISLLYRAHISGNQQMRELAEKVYEYGLRNRK